MKLIKNILIVLVRIKNIIKKELKNFIEKVEGKNVFM